MSAVLSTLVGWFLLASLVTGLGALAARWLILPRASLEHPATRRVAEHAVARLATLAGVMLPVALLLFFGRQLAEFRDPFAPLGEDVALLLSTPWGSIWKGGTVVAVVTGISLAAAGVARRWAWWAATGGVLALTAFPALTGHASGAAELRTLALLADTLHVAAAGGWMGGLAAVLYVETLWRRSREGGEGESLTLLPGLVPAFSPLAVVCVSTLVVTGVFASWLHLTHWADLFTTAYGRTLTVKLSLVAIVMALGGLNWKRLTPRLGTEDGNAALRRAATVELLVAHLVLFATAVLIRTSPGGM